MEPRIARRTARRSLESSRAHLGEIVTTVADVLAEPVRDDLRRAARRSLGIPEEDPPIEMDPSRAYLRPHGVARRIHGDLPSMMAGGLGALLLQSLHPLAMAGVAQHSNYRHDPFGRLERTATFIGATTYGSVDDANSAIERVRRVHTRVRGVAPDGRSYSASDPELLTFVHVAEMYSFYRGSMRFAPVAPTKVEADSYFEETAKIALALGATKVPISLNAVQRYLADIEPELSAGADAREAREFLLAGVATTPFERQIHRFVVAGALCVLPAFARRMLGLDARYRIERLTVAPWLVPLGAALRWSVAPEPASVG